MDDGSGGALLPSNWCCIVVVSVEDMESPRGIPPPVLLAPAVGVATHSEL